MTTYQGSAGGFIVWGALAVITSVGWGILWTKVVEYVVPSVIGRAITRSEHKRLVIALSGWAAVVGLILLGIGVARLNG